jgi:hypothetical protein
MSSPAGHRAETWSKRIDVRGARRTGIDQLTVTHRLEGQGFQTITVSQVGVVVGLLTLCVLVTGRQIEKGKDSMRVGCTWAEEMP